MDADNFEGRFKVTGVKVNVSTLFYGYKSEVPEGLGTLPTNLRTARAENRVLRLNASHV